MATKIPTKYDVIREIFPLFHCRDKDPETGQWKGGGEQQQQEEEEGGAGWHLLNCQAAVTPFLCRPNT